MWKQEAVWIGNHIKALNFSENNISCLNIGSSTKLYRESLKPYIYKYVIQPIERIGVITHLDAKPGVGVDICGDLSDPLFRSKVAERKYDLILCNNVLTHVPDPDHVYEIILKCLADDGFVIISAPELYPYCADPFDSKYRPSRADIESKLPALQTIQFMRFESSETMLSRLIANKHLLLAFLFNIIVPRRGLRVWKNVAADLFNLNRRFVTLGLIMHRQCRPVRHLASDV
jgi:SAM-dependent methyltransferase